jgi:hypothetical protein
MPLSIWLLQVVEAVITATLPVARADIEQFLHLLVPGLQIL